MIKARIPTRVPPPFAVVNTTTSTHPESSIPAPIPVAALKNKATPSLQHRAAKLHPHLLPQYTSITYLRRPTTTQPTYHPETRLRGRKPPWRLPSPPRVLRPPRPSLRIRSLSRTTKQTSPYVIPMCYANFTQHSGCGHLGPSTTAPLTLCDAALSRLHALRGPNSPPLTPASPAPLAPPKRSASKRRFLSLSQTLSRSSSSASGAPARAASVRSTAASFSPSTTVPVDIDYAALPAHQVGAVRCGEADTVRRSKVAGEMDVCEGCRGAMGEMRRMLERCVCLFSYLFCSILLHYSLSLLSTSLDRCRALSHPRHDVNPPPRPALPSLPSRTIPPPPPNPPSSSADPPN